MVQVCPHGLFLTLIVASLQASAEDFSDLFKLGTVTGETYLFVGDDLKLNCSLYDSSTQEFAGHNFIFKVQHEPNEPQRSTVKCISPSHITVVDNIAMLVIQNVTSENEGPYACYVGSANCTDNSRNNELVDTSENVFVEYAPHNVTNFDCMVYNWGDYMTCTWQHPVTYRDWSNITVEILFMLSGHPESAYKCPNASNNSCTWSKENVMLGNSYYIQVTVKNMRKNVSASTIYTAKTSTIVKPAPVHNLSITASTEKSGCLVLSWSHSDKYNGKKYRIKHEGDTIWEGTDKIFTSCGYLPDTLHKFSVECYPTELFSGNWSEPVYASFLTPMRAPEFGPRATNGSFMTTDCVRGIRNVTLMWQEVEAAARNGLIDHYLIKADNEVKLKVSADVNFGTVQLPCNEPSQVKILAHNEGGYSLEPTVLLISPVNFTVPMEVQETFSVNRSSEHGNTYQSVWQVSDRTRNMNYTIFWCTSRPGKPCEGLLQWSTSVPGTGTFYDIQLPEADVENYIYGISATDTQTGISSGIFWTSCLFSQNPFASNHKTVEDLKVEGDVEKAKIVWSKIPCTYQSFTKVTSYRVKWCEMDKCNDADRISSVDLPGTVNMYTVSALSAEVKYAVTVQPVSYQDVGDEVKPWKLVVPAASGNKIIWIIPVLVAVCVTVVGFLIYKKCKTSRAKMKLLLPDNFLVLADAQPRVVTHETRLTADADPSRQVTVRLLTAQSNNSINMVETSYDNRPDSRHGNIFPEVTTNLQHQQNTTVQTMLPSVPTSAESYHRVTHSPQDQLSQVRTEHQNKHAGMCRNHEPSASGTDQSPHSPSSQSSDVIRSSDVIHLTDVIQSTDVIHLTDAIQSTDVIQSSDVNHNSHASGHSSSGSIGSYQRAVNYPHNSSLEPTDVLYQDETTDQRLGHSSSGSLQPYHQVAFCESDQRSKVSDTYDENHQPKPVPSNPASIQRDLSDMIIHAYSPDTIIPSHQRLHVSHVQFDTNSPANNVTDQNHFAGTQWNVESRTPQPALTLSKPDIVITMTPDTSSQQGHNTVNMAASFNTKAEVSEGDDTLSDLTPSGVDTTLCHLQDNSGYVPYMSVPGHQITGTSSSHSSFSDDDSAVLTDCIQVTVLTSSSTQPSDSF